jgi:hypothetical protein
VGFFVFPSLKTFFNGYSLSGPAEKGGPYRLTTLHSLYLNKIAGFLLLVEWRGGIRSFWKFLGGRWDDGG